jgi:hypothetical protein
MAKLGMELNPEEEFPGDPFNPRVRCHPRHFQSDSV